MVAEAELGEEGGEVVFHGCCAAHLGHELEESGAPEAGEEMATGEKGGPGVAGSFVGFDAVFDFVQLVLGLEGGVVALAEIVKGGLGLGEPVLLGEPAGSLGHEGQAEHEYGCGNVLKSDR